MKLRVAIRLIEIQRVLVRHGLDDFVRATHLYRPLRFVFLLSPWTWFERRRSGSRAERLRLALEELGPIFVKFGQAVSTRRDLLPLDIADELAKLQDRVPPFDGRVAQQVIESAFGKSTDELFGQFDVAPLAAASIAQVHTARLPNSGTAPGTEVVVKVLRPGMREVIQRDIEVLFALARQAERWWPESKRLRPLEVVAEYEKTILDELDLLREAANATQLKRNFDGSQLLYVPAIYWDLCRSNVMVMERIRGIQISNMARLRELQVDIRKLAENGVEIFFTQVFRHNFFHADMHPGNIFVLADDPANPVYAAVDFGIVGTLDLRDQRYLAENFLAVFDRDYRRVAALHVESGWVPRDTRIDEMESAIRTVCEPIFDKPLKEISFGTVLLRLFEISRRFNMTVQPQLILLQKTLLNIEGLGRDLYPDLDIWQTASPVLRKWMADRFSARSVMQSLRGQLPDVIETLRALPPLLRVAAQHAQEGTLRLGIEAAELTRLRRDLDAHRSQRDVVLVAAVLLLAGIVWLAVDRAPAWPGWALCAAAAAALVWRIRRRR
ncbi:MAG TPA: ubiquinone biosynthesis regulatory protein kinase UbiB [Steroidobacteraceae bacterium]|nr:ubiquinone biosynthesis regulatory protein kinase UbiB [Steroidobacteraceae bacterium]HRX88042.1 ubiquinone biosynthesis regulatory protein kinase UbiB [Steroidobacteraceae bacterium]